MSHWPSVSQISIITIILWLTLREQYCRETKQSDQVLQPTSKRYIGVRSGIEADLHFVAYTQEELNVLHLMSQGTRSQVRQVEMEQQLSTLINMVQTVQEQQTGQQELCRG